MSFNLFHFTGLLIVQKLMQSNYIEAFKCLHYWPFVLEEPPVTGGFSWQRANNGESVSWYQYGIGIPIVGYKTIYP